MKTATGIQNNGVTGTFSVSLKTFKPTKDWKKPGKTCTGEIKGTSGDKKHPIEVSGSFTAECLIMP